MRLTRRPALDTRPPKFFAFSTRAFVVAFNFQPRAFVAGMAFAAPLQGIGDSRIPATVAATEMVSQDIAGQ